MLRFRVRLTFEPSKADEASQTFRSLLGPVRAEPGCSATHFLRDMNSELAVTWVEEWRSREDFTRHLDAATFRKVVAVMELASQEPIVEIDDVTRRQGFEMVERHYRERYRETSAELQTGGQP